MLDIARQNLRGIKNIDLRVGNNAMTDYQDNFFDCIISSGSFYNWDRPVDGLNEVYRILKSGKTAYIVETYKNHDKALLNFRLIYNLKGYSYLR
jgi:ubiquinone/menaquinone biosynthesis C-methylase UbiE